MGSDEDKVERSPSSWRELVLERVRTAGETGMTCEELEDAFAALHQNISARLWELHRMGEVFDSGRRRMNRSGRDAIVWQYGTAPKPQLALFGEARVSDR